MGKSKQAFFAPSSPVKGLGGSTHLTNNSLNSVPSFKQKLLDFSLTKPVAVTKSELIVEVKPTETVDISPDDFKYVLPEGNQPIPVEAAPVSFLANHWAVYAARFNEKWYIAKSGSRGVTPLDYFGISWGRLVNSFTFNFSIMRVNEHINTRIKWLTKHVYHRNLLPDAILDACKIYAYEMYHPDADPSVVDDLSLGKEPDFRYLFGRATEEFQEFLTLDTFAGFHPIIDTCESSSNLECDDFVVLNSPVRRGNEYYYPLVPSALYSVSQFKILNWGFLDKK